MRKLLFFGNSTWCIYNFRLGIIQEFLARGFEVNVLAPLDATYDDETYIKEFNKLGVNFHTLHLSARSTNPLRELESLAELYRFLRLLRPDVVLTFTVKCNLYSGLCRRILGFPQIANVPGLGEVFAKRNLVQYVVTALYKIALSGVTTAFFQNPTDQEHCTKHRLVNSDACRLLPGSGVNTSRFMPNYPRRKPGRTSFLMFGRLLPQKGYYLYLEAAREIRRLLPDEDIEFWIQGFEDQNRPDSIELVSKIREAERQGIVRFRPGSADVLPILKDIDAVVLPTSYNEGIPHSLLEAMSCGKVVLTADWKGCRETVHPGMNGFFVSNSSAADLAQVMLKCIQMPDQELYRMGVESRRLAETRFNEQLVIDSYLGEVAKALHLPKGIEEKGAFAVPRRLANS